MQVGIGLGPTLGGAQVPFAPNAAVALDFQRSKFRIGAAGAMSTTFLGLTGASFTNSTGGYVQRASGLLVPVAANQPRISDLGLLIEGGSTNLLKSSGAIANGTDWFTTGTVNLNAGTAPDGTQTATSYDPSGASGLTYQAAAVAVSTTYTYSEYVKFGTMAQASFKIAFYDATNSAFIATDVVPTLTPLGNGWYRASAQVTTPATCTSMRVYGFRNSVTTISGTVLLWGAQLETTSAPSSYIPTTTAAASRAGDTVTLAVTVPTEGIFACAYTQPQIPPTTRADAWAISDSAASRLALRAQDGGGSQPRLIVDNASVSQTVQGGSSNAAGASVRTAAAYSSLSAKAALCENGAAAVTGAFQANAAVTGAQTLTLGNGAGSLLNSYIQNLYVYPTYDQGAFLRSLAA